MLLVLSFVFIGCGIKESAIGIQNGENISTDGDNKR